MTGLDIKLGIGRARQSSVGSLALPESQEKRIFVKLDEARQDMRQLTKTIASSGKTVAFGLGASAIATVFAGAAVVWGSYNDRMKKRGR